MISNEQFLTSIFGDNAPFTHVTSFLVDPLKTDRYEWFGGYAKDVGLIPDSNQYFTISIFNSDEKGQARRRKVLFMATYVIVLDDVREKLPIEQVNLLGQPSYILETSPGSEQWGYILDVPCTDRQRVENLLDGLVSQGLAPDGVDPGMKGVTRYVRLPQGINTKASKQLVDGTFPPSTMIAWNPEVRVSLEALAAPFNINLDAERRDSRVDGAANVPDHPLLNAVTVKEALSDGRYDITCPWVTEHTDESDDGAALFTNEDGTFGFKCHHGNCQQRTGRDLVEHLGVKAELDDWQIKRTFSKFAEPDFLTVELDFLSPEVVVETTGYRQLVDNLKSLPVGDAATLQYAYEILKFVDQMEEALKIAFHKEIRSHMGWKVAEFKAILSEQRSIWYPVNHNRYSFYDDHVYVKEQDRFYSISKRMWFAKEVFINSHISDDPEIRDNTFGGDMVRIVDRVNYTPGQGQFFERGSVSYLNTWQPSTVLGVKGDPSPWINHFGLLGWEKYRKHIEQWMAYTILHPEHKINHILILAGGEGIGKDMILDCLKLAMAGDISEINGQQLLGDFNQYLMNCKLLTINEVEMGNRKDAQEVYNKLKPLASAPPNNHTVNIKHLTEIKVDNIQNVCMTTNSAIPIAAGEDSRRFFPVWSDLNTRGESGDMLPEWTQYYKDFWNWYRSGGADAIIWHLRNEVDLSDFDPTAAPPVTDFMRSIHENTGDPVAQMIKDMIQNKIGAFATDIVLYSDMVGTIEHCNIFGYQKFKTTPSAQIISRLMKQHRLGEGKSLTQGSCVHKKAAIIRNHELYQGGGTELYKLWEKQRKEIET